MKIVIIGSEGFIGKHCVNLFISKGYDVYGIDLIDAINTNYQYFKISRLQPAFNYYLEKIDFSICINAAGSGSVPISIENPVNDFEANTIDSFHVLEAIRKKGVQIKYLNISSAAVYGNPFSLPIKETDEIKPLSPYGWHKYYSELICKEYHQLYGIKTCSVRPFSVYGPGLKKQLFWDLYKKSEGKNEIQLFGTGKESRDFIYIEDLVKAISVIVERAEMSGEVYNIANGVESTIKESAMLFFEYLNPSIKVNFTGEVKAGDPKNWKADISKITSLGFCPDVGIEVGLKNTVLWLKEKKLL